MKASTAQVIRSILATDGTVSEEQIEQAIRILQGRASATRAATDQPLLLNQATTERLLGVSRFTIRRLVEDGKLHPVRMRGAVRYNRKQIESLANPPDVTGQLKSPPDGQFKIPPTEGRFKHVDQYAKGGMRIDGEPEERVHNPFDINVGLVELLLIGYVCPIYLLPWVAPVVFIGIQYG